jgi:hypothetical protein
VSGVAVCFEDPNCAQIKEYASTWLAVDPAERHGE